MMKVRTRFAPSPTGFLHIGSIRTALFSWLYAKRQQGEFVLRIEDTDRVRSTDASIQAILDAMDWLGLHYDSGPHYQSQRSACYQAIVQRLLDTGHAYYCYCSREAIDAMRKTAIERGEKPRYNRHCRDKQLGSSVKGLAPVVRFKTPLAGEVLVEDLVQGPIKFSNQELDDLVIARQDGTATYNLSVVVDDLDMQISDVIRGDDHLNNTPRQINILHALGARIPRYAHIPMILGEDGKKLSKRAGTACVLQYREAGYLRSAILNYLVRLGWSHGDQEVFSLQEMMDLFDIRDINKSAASLNPTKLIWLNQHYLRCAEDAELAPRLGEVLVAKGITLDQGPALEVLVNIQKGRTKTLQEMAEQSRYFYSDFTTYEPLAAKKYLRVAMQQPFTQLGVELAQLADWTTEPLHQAIERVAQSCGLKIGRLAQPLRVAVMGSGVSPGIADSLFLLGRERTLQRLDKALRYIAQRQQETEQVS